MRKFLWFILLTFFASSASAETVIEPYWGLMFNDHKSLTATSSFDNVGYLEPEFYGLRLGYLPNDMGWSYLFGLDTRILNSRFHLDSESGVWRGFESGLIVGAAYHGQSHNCVRLWLTALAYHHSKLKADSVETELTGYGGKFTIGFDPPTPQLQNVPVGMTFGDYLERYLWDLFLSVFSYNFTYEYRHYGQVTSSGSPIRQREDRIVTFDISFPIGF